jgi:30S ribosome assembly GTPase
MLKIINCLGCGIAIQHDDQKLPGYQEKKGQPYCQACYKLLHYGKVQEHLHPKDLPNLNANALMLMISSVMQLDLLFSYPIHRYQPDATYVYVINQIDLLPTSTKHEELIKNIIIKAKKEKIPYHDIILMSAKNPYDIDNLKTYLQNFSNKDIYLLGVQNSGKTTLFKALTDNPHALAFKKAGLTQNALTASFGKKTLYDMPGLYQKGYLHQALPYEVYKELLPENLINPKIYPIKNGQTIFVEGLFAITYEGEPSSLVFYLNKNIKYHKTNALKIEGLLQEKETQFRYYVENYETKKFKANHPKNQLTMADMGIMHVIGPCHLSVTFPKGIHVSLTEALFQ